MAEGIDIAAIVAAVISAGVSFYSLKRTQQHDVKNGRTETKI